MISIVTSDCLFFSFFFLIFHHPPCREGGFIFDYYKFIMSHLVRRIAVSQPQQLFIRSVSTQYVPGRKGYAPGFEAPEGTRETKKMIHKRGEIATSLTSHLPNSNGTKNVTSESTKKLYRQELKVTRHKYARELLEKQGQRELASAEKLAQTKAVHQKEKELLDQAKEEQRQHEQKVVDMLSLHSTVNTSDRNQKRIENRLFVEENQRNTRRKQLLKLYTTTEDFVTLDNLDAKVDAIISTEGRSFHESLTELMHNTNSVQSEVEQRKAQLKEVMGL